LDFEKKLLTNKKIDKGEDQQPVNGTAMRAVYKGRGGVLMEGMRAGVQKMRSTEGWVQYSGIEEEGFGEEGGAEGNKGCG
jgi:hypothetical protein